MHSVLQDTVGSSPDGIGVGVINSVVVVVGNSASVGIIEIGRIDITISDGSVSSVLIEVLAHILKDCVAAELGITATVLTGPFESKKRTLIEIHGWGDGITSLCIVLGIEESVLIIGVGISLIESIIASGGILEIEISSDGRKE